MIDVIETRYQAYLPARSFDWFVNLMLFAILKKVLGIVMEIS